MKLSIDEFTNRELVNAIVRWMRDEVASGETNISYFISAIEYDDWLRHYEEQIND